MPQDKIETKRHEALLTEFEWSLWRISSAFLRWQGECSSQLTDTPFSGHDTAILHTIRYRGRPKGLSEICRLLGREDTSNVQYSIKKLLSVGLIERLDGRSRKETLYRTSAKGLKLTHEYRRLREELLVSLVHRMSDAEPHLLSTTETLELLTGFYESALRRISSDNPAARDLRRKAP